MRIGPFRQATVSDVNLGTQGLTVPFVMSSSSNSFKPGRALRFPSYLNVILTWKFTVCQFFALLSSNPPTSQSKQRFTSKTVVLGFLAI